LEDSAPEKLLRRMYVLRDVASKLQQVHVPAQPGQAPRYKQLNHSAREEGFCAACQLYRPTSILGRVPVWGRKYLTCG
jgi:hypothetical protein